MKVKIKLIANFPPAKYSAHLLIHLILLSRWKTAITDVTDKACQEKLLHKAEEESCLNTYSSCHTRRESRANPIVIGKLTVLYFAREGKYTTHFQYYFLSNFQHRQRNVVDKSTPRTFSTT